MKNLLRKYIRSLLIELYEEKEKELTGLAKTGQQALDEEDIDETFKSNATYKIKQKFMNKGFKGLSAI